MSGLDGILLGGALVPLGLWALHHAGVASTATVLLAFQLGLNLPHYFQTYGLTYLDPETRARAPRRLWGALAVSVTVPIATILCGPTALRWTLAFVGYWAFWHITQQTRGLAGAYLRRGGSGDLRQALLAFLFLSTCAVLAGRLATHGITLGGDPLAPAWLLAGGLALASLVPLWRARRAPLPALSLTMGHTAAMALSMSVSDLSLALALATSWHALQYLALTFSSQRSRDSAALLPRLAREEIAGFFLLSFVFAVAAAGIGAALPPPWGQAIYLPLLIAHYLTDAWIWRPDRNPAAKQWLAPLAASAAASASR